MSWMQPIVLEGREVRLEPAGVEHIDRLWAVADDPSIWRHIPLPVRDRDEMAFFVEYFQATGCYFATVERATDTVVGGTGFLVPDEHNRRLEIGATWITPDRQRSAVNTEAKLLQLTHAFEVLGCARVEFKTDARNARSRAALARIGATEEGTFRKHMLLPDGTWRDSVYFSIIDTEWPDVSARLRGLIDERSERSP